MAWERCSNMVISWLLNNLNPDIANSVSYAESAHEVWMDLEDRFSQGNGPRVIELKRSINTSQQEQQSVSAYYTGLKTLWDELASYTKIPTCTCGASKEYQTLLHSERVYQFLMGLNEGFGTLKSHVLTMEPMPNMNKVYALVQQDEKQKTLKAPAATIDAAALAASRHHSFKGSQTIGEKQRSLIVCAYCNGIGHTRSKCFELVGYPSWHPKSRTQGSNKVGSPKVAAVSTSRPTRHSTPSSVSSPELPLQQLIESQYKQLLTLLNSVGQPSVANFSGITFCNNALHSPSTSWIIDSGTTNHFTPNLSLLSNVDENTIYKPVCLPNGSRTQLTHTRKSFLSSTIALDNVLCVPTFNFNLLSISQVTNSLNCAAIFFPSFCVFQDLRTKKLIGMGEMRDGLYHYTPPANKAVALPANCGLDLGMWHQRLGHRSQQCLSYLSPFFLNSSSCSQKSCDVCILAKQTRFPFSASSSRSTSAFDLIHCDIWGGYLTPQSGAHYFLTIVDDFSQCTWVYLMKFKSETYSFLKHFLAMVKTQYRCQVKQVRSDNGLEFFSNPMNKLLLEHGILHQSSCVGTPQQNGVVEQKHRHLLEVARALRFQARLPKTFWGECFNCCIFDQSYPNPCPLWTDST